MSFCNEGGLDCQGNVSDIFGGGAAFFRMRHRLCAEYSFKAAGKTLFSSHEPCVPHKKPQAGVYSFIFCGPVFDFGFYCEFGGAGVAFKYPAHN